MWESPRRCGSAREYCYWQLHDRANKSSWQQPAELFFLSPCKTSAPVSTLRKPTSMARCRVNHRLTLPCSSIRSRKMFSMTLQHWMTFSWVYQGYRNSWLLISVGHLLFRAQKVSFKRKRIYLRWGKGRRNINTAIVSKFLVCSSLLRHRCKFQAKRFLTLELIRTEGNVPIPQDKCTTLLRLNS